MASAITCSAQARRCSDIIRRHAQLPGASQAPVRDGAQLQAASRRHKRQDGLDLCLRLTRLSLRPCSRVMLRSDLQWSAIRATLYWFRMRRQTCCSKGLSLNGVCSKYKDKLMRSNDGKYKLCGVSEVTGADCAHEAQVARPSLSSVRTSTAAWDAPTESQISARATEAAASRGSRPNCRA